MLNSCKAKEEGKPTEKIESASALKVYQQYALDRIHEADADDGGFYLADSFYLWSWDDFGREFKRNRITRTFDSGFFYYSFWTHLRDTSFVYAEDRIPAKDVIKDTMFDNDLDGFMDFVVVYGSDEKDSMIFHLDTTSRKFTKIRP